MVNSERGRTAGWAVLATLVLFIRIVSTIATVFLVIAWAVVAVRSSLWNGLFWPAVVAGATCLVSTYLYGLLRQPHPGRRNHRV